MSRYSASICMRGHYRDPIVELHTSGPEPELYCSNCGAPVIAARPVCSARLLGGYVHASGPYEPEQFCCQCGSPFPWANRDALVMHLQNQLEFEPGLDAADRLELIEQLAVLSRPEQDTKRRVNAGERVKQLAPKGRTMAQPVLQALLSAELRRQLGLPPG